MDLLEFVCSEKQCQSGRHCTKWANARFVSSGQGRQQGPSNSRCVCKASFKWLCVCFYVLLWAHFAMIMITTAAREWYSEGWRHVVVAAARVLATNKSERGIRSRSLRNELCIRNSAIEQSVFFSCALPAPSGWPRHPVIMLCRLQFAVAEEEQSLPEWPLVPLASLGRNGMKGCNRKCYSHYCPSTYDLLYLLLLLLLLPTHFEHFYRFLVIRFSALFSWWRWFGSDLQSTKDLKRQ